jgi:predicted membrane protein
MASAASMTKAGGWPLRALRASSFLFALTASLVLMLCPFLLRYVPDSRLHSALPMLTLGIAGAFIYGIGYRPDSKMLRLLFGPACSWGLMIAGILWIAAR